MRHLRPLVLLLPVLMIFCNSARADTITDHFLLTYTFLGVTQSDNFATDVQTYNPLQDPLAGFFSFHTHVYSGTDQSGTPDVSTLETDGSGGFTLVFKNSPLYFSFYVPDRLFTITRSAQDTNVYSLGFNSGTYHLQNFYVSLGPNGDYPATGTLTVSQTTEASPVPPTPVAVTPEPSSLALLGTGVLCFAGAVKRRHTAA